MSEYHKIYGPYKRFTEGPLRNKLDLSQWTSNEFFLLQHHDWIWTEKIDGTNIRIIWDGHRVTFRGRTDNAQLHAQLLEHLHELCPEELFEQTFGEKEVVLYGEGCGAGIQKGGGNYSSSKKFVLFDVKFASGYAHRNTVDDIGDQLGVPVTPVRLTGTVHEAFEVVTSGLTSDYGNFEAEGLVGTPVGGFLSPQGRRIIMKVKAVDFRE